MNETSSPREHITGVILAGGRSRRMGGIDKGLVPFQGRPMVERVLRVLRTDVSALLINANRNREVYRSFGYPVVTDIRSGYLGPLAGMASGMYAAETPYVVTVPCDCPLVGSGLVHRLYRALEHEQAQISVAHDGERMHPVFALIRRDLLPDLLAFLDSGERKIDRWYNRHRLAVANFDDTPQWFQNVNSPEERTELEASVPWS